MKNKAFTLVELIVVITILAILGTIAFISLQGYSADARNTTRISDMGSIKKVLELSFLKVGKYPNTSSGSSITYSGSTAWTQGTYGEDTHKITGKLSTIPVDPLSDIEYTYSVTTDNKEYQLAGVIEGGALSYNDFNTSKVNAANGNLSTVISGNYNGKILKVSKNSTTFVLAVPTIISGEIVNLESIVNNNKFLYNGYKNLPANYSNKGYDMNPENNFVLVNSANIKLYEGNLDGLQAESSQKAFATNIKNAYSGTVLSTKSTFNDIISIDSTASIDDESLFIVQNLINQNVTAKVKAVKKPAKINILSYFESSLSDMKLPSFTSELYDLEGSEAIDTGFDSLDPVFATINGSDYKGKMTVNGITWRIEDITEYDLIMDPIFKITATGVVNGSGEDIIATLDVNVSSYTNTSHLSNKLYINLNSESDSEDDSGDTNYDNSTTEKSPIIDGLAELSAVEVKIFNGAIEIGSDTSLVDRKYSVDLSSDLTAGAHTLTAKSYNISSIEISSSDLDITIVGSAGGGGGSTIAPCSLPFADKSNPGVTCSL